MCGIMGYVAFEDKYPEKEVITDMFISLQSRGRDASGFAYIDDGKLKVVKSPIPSKEMVLTDDWLNLKLPKILIAHTRLKTQGHETNNMNNHPIYNKKGIALVHNGIVYNDKEVFGKKQRDAEVDSEAILHVYTKAKKNPVDAIFRKVEGSYALAIIEQSRPDALTLVRNSSPLELCYDKKDKILYFNSEKMIIRSSLQRDKEVEYGFILGEEGLHYFNFEDNHSMEINATGVINYQKHYHNARHWNSYYREDTRIYDYGSWKSKKETCPENATVQTEDEFADWIECPYCLSVTWYDKRKYANYCEYCNALLEEEVIEDYYDEN